MLFFHCVSFSSASSSHFLCCGNLFDLAAEPLTRIDCPKGQKTASGLKDNRQVLLWARTLLVGGQSWGREWRAEQQRKMVRWMVCVERNWKVAACRRLSHALAPNFFALWLLAIDSSLIFQFFFFCVLLSVTEDRFRGFPSVVPGD